MNVGDLRSLLDSYSFQVQKFHGVGFPSKDMAFDEQVLRWNKQGNHGDIGFGSKK
ncbi:MAG: hypothetical protein VW455_00565 [Nitrospinota bacterium]